MHDWIPSPEDIGAVIRARTREKNGVVVGTFTDKTNPKRADIMPLIDDVAERISAACGEIPETKLNFARRTAAIGVAIEIEGSYFMDEIQSDRSAYDRLLERFDKRFDELVMFVKNDDGTDGTPEDLMPLGNFDDRTLLGFKVYW